MKKFPIMLSVLLSAMAFVHGATPSTYSDENYTYANGTFTFNQNLVWVDFSRRIDLSFQTKSNISTDDIASFGYYVINDDGSKGDYVTLYTKDGGSTNSSVIFGKDQRIGIFMDVETATKTTSTVTVSEGKYVAHKNGDYYRNADGQYVKITKSMRIPPNTQRYKYVAPVTQTVTSDVVTTDRYTTTATEDAKTAGAQIDPDSFDLKDGSTHQYFCLFTQGATGTGAHYEYFFNGIAGTSDKTVDEFIAEIKNQHGDINVIVEGEHDGVNGQPLPGLIGTVVVAGIACAGYGVGRRRKK